MRLTTLLVLLILMWSVHANASIIVDVEGGKVFPGYNDVRIPGDSGTDVSLRNDIEMGSVWYARARIGYLLTERHFISLMVAPLRVEGSGKVNHEVLFDDTIFPAYTPLTATFQFNTYRAGYRYIFFNHERGAIGAGITLLVRDAFIELEGGGQRAKYSNLGFVPLINVMVLGKITHHFGVLIEGEGLASSQGRAFDIFTALVFPLSDAMSIKAGYRFLEGGSDNDKVYTFSLFHFATVGIEFRWQ